MPPTPPLRNYLRTYRKRTGLSERELAFLLGCKHGSKVGRYESGERVPSLQTLLALEIIFRATIRELYVRVHRDVLQEVRPRVQTLLRQLDEQTFTPIVKRKFDSLVDVVYPGSGKNNGKSA